MTRGQASRCTSTSHAGHAHACSRAGTLTALSPACVASCSRHSTQSSSRTCHLTGARTSPARPSDTAAGGSWRGELGPRSRRMSQFMCGVCRFRSTYDNRFPSREHCEQSVQKRQIQLVKPYTRRASREARPLSLTPGTIRPGDRRAGSDSADTGTLAFVGVSYLFLQNLPVARTFWDKAWRNYIHGKCRESKLRDGRIFALRTQNTGGDADSKRETPDLNLIHQDGLLFLAIQHRSTH
jgi:hypothetical protein